LIKGGGVYINGQRVVDEKSRVSPEDAMHARYFVVRKGKRDNFLVRVYKDVPSS
jgi:tyrosyl-tRNA synthetase